MAVRFGAILAFFTLILCLVPAAIVWFTFYGILTSSILDLEKSATVSLEGMADKVQDLLLSESKKSITARVSEGEKALNSLLSYIDWSGLNTKDVGPWSIPSQDIFNQLQGPIFATMRSHSYIDFLSTSSTQFPNFPQDNTDPIMWWVLYQSLLIDVVTNKLGHTLYYSTLSREPTAIDTTNYRIFYPNQTTGKSRFQIHEQSFPSVGRQGILLPGPMTWYQDLEFSALSGQLQILIWEWVPAGNNTWMQMTLAVNSGTISTELQEILNTTGSPGDRLFMFFTQPHGHLMAASHGKYHSHSDQNLQITNPLADPPQVHLWQRYTCLNSTDEYILAACKQLIAEYKEFPAIPAGNKDMTLKDRRFWVGVAHTGGSLNCTVVLLKDRESVMGPTEAKVREVRDSVWARRMFTFVTLGVGALLASLLPLLFGLWVGRRLMKLADNMDEIAMLQFNNRKRQSTMIKELHHFQSSFGKMERGLKAFQQFVPQAIVKTIVGGTMQIREPMRNQMLTIMFCDIEGFSSICEYADTEALTNVCSEYFEMVCNHIVRRNGTIDKFIGDTVMAMWNAPNRCDHQERDAIHAALAMQTTIFRLHDTWKSHGDPKITFRVGINTGPCLVGNFGCSYRVNYTCFGDPVNVASRLQLLNKHFGTYICVSERTAAGALNDFYFRRLAKVKVPGRDEVEEVSEVLCPAQGAQEVDYEVSDELIMSLIDMDEKTGNEKRFDTGKMMLASNDHEFVYHWAKADPAAVIANARAYEQAYDALVAGDHQTAAQMINKRRHGVQDAAWDLLQRQLERHTTEGFGKWDGVFNLNDGKSQQDGATVTPRGTRD